MSKIARIIRASNHFDCLQLPKPYADLMGEPVWDVTEEQRQCRLSKAKFIMVELF